jgi:hypothetical protein
MFAELVLLVQTKAELSISVAAGEMLLAKGAELPVAGVSKRRASSAKT